MLFRSDQQEMRYRDIHSDLRAVKESMEKAAKEKTKVAKAAGEGPESKPVLFEGRTDGSIVPPRGSKGFGWDRYCDQSSTNTQSASCGQTSRP